MDQDEETGPRVAIIGAGMSGICMALKLQRAGLHRFTIFEKSTDVGGTWKNNRYPGVGCDVPAPFYSYSFALNPNWSKRFSEGAQIHGYFKDVARNAGLLDRVRFGTEIAAARFQAGGWELESSDGERFTFDAVVAATGVLHHPRIPDIPGMESFDGALFHSAHWDREVPLDGRRIGVIGTGSTGVQIVTALASRAATVTQFQRSAQWIMPVPNVSYSGALRRLWRRFDSLRRLSYRAAALQFSVFGRAVIRPGIERRVVQGICRLNLRTVRDKGLRARLTPDHEPMCRRLVLSSGYYRAVQRPSVDVVDAGIDHIEPRGIVTADGRLHELDVIALATGFDAHAFLRPMEVTGNEGTTLSQAWVAGPRAHRTTMLPGFPNFFLLMGPNSPIGNTSLVPIAEGQADFVVRWLRRIAEGELRHVAPTEDATLRFNTSIRDNMGDTVWVTGCDSWYIGPDGQPTLWPFPLRDYYEMLARPADHEYDVHREPAVTPSPS